MKKRADNFVTAKYLRKLRQRNPLFAGASYLAHYLDKRRLRRGMGSSPQLHHGAGRNLDHSDPEIY